MAQWGRRSVATETRHPSSWTQAPPKGGCPPQACPVLVQSIGTPGPDMVSQRWFLRPWSRGVTSTRAEPRPERLTTPHSWTASVPPWGTAQGFKSGRFHHLSRNISAPGPRNHLNSLERQGPETARTGPRSHSPPVHTWLPHTCPKLLHVPDQPTKESRVRSSCRPAPGNLDTAPSPFGFPQPRRRISHFLSHASLPRSPARCAEAAQEPPQPPSVTSNPQ